PAYQSGVTQSSTKRTSPDVAYDADPATGVAVYDSMNGGWLTVGGTSAGAPQWAALLAIADQGRALAGKNTLGSAGTPGAIYNMPATNFHDITSGNNGYAAGPGYDLVTGRGSPKANLVINHLVNNVASAAASAPAAPGGATIRGRHAKRMVSTPAAPTQSAASTQGPLSALPPAMNPSRPADAAAAPVTNTPATTRRTGPAVPTPFVAGNGGILTPNLIARSVEEPADDDSADPPATMPPRPSGPADGMPDGNQDGTAPDVVPDAIAGAEADGPTGVAETVGEPVSVNESRAFPVALAAGVALAVALVSTAGVRPTEPRSRRRWDPSLVRP